MADVKTISGVLQELMLNIRASGLDWDYVWQDTEQELLWRFLVEMKEIML
jgi:hypothetical protein